MAFKDEFISRDSQLPSDGNVPATDMRQGQRARVAQEQTPLGTPSADYTVRSVYDSRPISGGDFNVLVTANLSGELIGTPISSEFVVPQGYVAILREVITWAENPIPFSVNRRFLSIALQVNKSDIQFNSFIPVGSATDVPIKCFVIADELQTLGVRWIRDISLSSTVNAHLYGNLLLKTGRPAQFEVGNYAGPGNITQPGMAESSVGVIPESATQVHGLGRMVVRSRRRLR